MPVAQSDNITNNNGLLEDVDSASLIDATFDTALDYLSHYMDRAVADWTTLTGSAPSDFDVVTHSTGGLVARAYIQSIAYTEQNRPSGSEHLLPINNLIQTGVPNQGVGATFAFLNNDFSVKSAARLLSLTIGEAYKLHTADNGKTVKNPDGSDLVAASAKEFAGAYVGTFKSLLSNYDLLDDIEDEEELFRALTSSDEFFNTLLADLNANSADAFVARGTLNTDDDMLGVEFINADNNGNSDKDVSMAELLALYDANSNGTLEVSDTGMPAALSAADTSDDQGGAADGIISYAELLRLYDKQTSIVYSDQIPTADLFIQRTGPQFSLGLKNEILGIDNTLIGNLPGIDQVWYQITDDPAGDGTVSAFSATDGFSASRLVEVSALASVAVSHSNIVHNETSQRKIVELLGVTDHSQATISTDELRSQVDTVIFSIQNGILDPVALMKDLYAETMERIDGLTDVANTALEQPSTGYRTKLKGFNWSGTPGFGIINSNRQLVSFNC